MKHDYDEAKRQTDETVQALRDLLLQVIEDGERIRAEARRERWRCVGMDAALGAGVGTVAVYCAIWATQHSDWRRPYFLLCMLWNGWALASAIVQACHWWKYFRRRELDIEMKVRAARARLESLQ